MCMSRLGIRFLLFPHENWWTLIIGLALGPVAHTTLQTLITYFVDLEYYHVCEI